MLQEVDHINDTAVLIFRYIQCLHLMYSEVTWVLFIFQYFQFLHLMYYEIAWVLVSSGTKVQP